MKLAENVARQIGRQKLLKAGDRVAAAVSGGADSVALLRLLLGLREELGIVLSVIHFHHKLRGPDADEDEKFVRELARHFSLEFHSGNGNVREFASEKHLSIEAAARKLRYEYFTRLLEGGVVNRVATGHTLDDQAETVLLRMARGAGTRGLAGIHPVVKTAEDRWIVRPLLQLRRTELEVHLRELGQSWREDASNRDLCYTRNRVRHRLLPVLEQELNSSIRHSLATLAQIALAEEEYWNSATKRVMAKIWEPVSREIRLKPFFEVTLALQRRVIRAAAQTLGMNLDFRQVEEIRLCAAEMESGARVELPHGWSAYKKKELLWFLFPGSSVIADHYAYMLPVPGEVCIPEARLRLQAMLVSSTEQSYNSLHLYDPGLIAPQLYVRNWKAGDRFWPAHTKAPKKIKELLQERHVPSAEKKSWPVIVSGDEIIWVRGFENPAHLRATCNPAMLIRESSL